jgi:hypothetical protein
MTFPIAGLTGMWNPKKAHRTKNGNFFKNLWGNLRNLLFYKIKNFDDPDSLKSSILKNP